MTETVTCEQAADLILTSAGKWLSVTFIKRTTGELRRMNCRIGVHSRLRGGEWANGMAGRPRDHYLLVVHDVQKDEYRSIPVENIISLTIAGQTYLTEDAMAFTIHPQQTA